MPQILNSSVTAGPPPAAARHDGILMPMHTAAGTLVARVREWRRSTRSHNELRMMSDRALRDIGDMRDEAARETCKPFWEA